MKDKRDLMDYVKEKLNRGLGTITTKITGLLYADDQLMKAWGVKNIPMLPETWTGEYRRIMTINEEIDYAKNCDLMELIRIEAEFIGATLGWNKYGTLFIKLNNRVCCLGRKRMKIYNERPNKTKTAKDVLRWVTWYDSAPLLEQDDSCV